MDNREIEYVEEIPHKRRKRSSGKTVTVIFSIIICMIVIAGTYLIGVKNPLGLSCSGSLGNIRSVSSTAILNRIEKASDLVTSRIVIEGNIHMDNGKIPFLTQNKFGMYYQAVVKAGIDISKVKVDVDDAGKKVYVNLPKAEITDVNVDENTVNFYDENFALFKYEEKEDAAAAITEAEEAAKETALNLDLLDSADEQAQTVIKALIQDMVPDDYEIVFSDSIVNVSEETES